MLLDELHSKRDALHALGGRYGARRIRVFGSVARREERADSDVDFPRGYDLFRQRLPLAEKLQALLGRSVEVIPEAVASRPAAHHNWRGSWKHCWVLICQWPSSSTTEGGWVQRILLQPSKCDPQMLSGAS